MHDVNKTDEKKRHGITKQALRTSTKLVPTAIPQALSWYNQPHLSAAAIWCDEEMLLEEC